VAFFIAGIIPVLENVFQMKMPGRDRAFHFYQRYPDQWSERTLGPLLDELIFESEQY
jgi:hypothetical protein